MRSKQKPSPFTDMRVFGERLTERELFLLQRARLMKYPFQAYTSARPNLKSDTAAKAESGLDAIWEKEVSNAAPRLPAETANAVKKPSATWRRSVKEINLLPLADQKIRSAFAFRLSLANLPGLAGFLSLCLLTITLFPLLQFLESKRAQTGLVLGEATTAYAQLQQAQAALVVSDYEAADDWLVAAYGGFASALSRLISLGSLAGSAVSAMEGKKLLLAAQEATLALQYVVNAVSELSDLRLGPSGLDSGTGSDVRLRSQAAFKNFRTGLDYLRAASLKLSGLDLTAVPQALQSEVRAAQAILEAVGPGLEQFTQVENLLGGLLSDREKTYLLLFQNPRELRATGGFIGTYGVMRMQNGKILNLKIESVYNPDGQLTVSIAAPGPLARYLTKTWAMRDSNWFFNFPDSAKKAADFLALETGIAADEVAAFTPEIFRRLLSLTGPVEMPQYGVSLSAENFTDTVQYQTSVAYDRELNQPKKFLADFTPRLLQRISELPTKLWLEALRQFSSSLASKDLLFFSFDPAQQQIYESLNWAGQVRESPGDYLAVVHSNVGAGKTDQVIVSDIRLTAEIAFIGGQRNTLTIQRVAGDSGEKDFPLNRDFMRVFVPAGSRLVSASGFDEAPYMPSSGEGLQTDSELAALDATAVVYPYFAAAAGLEAGKTVFSGWVSLSPNSEREITLVYDLPSAYNFTDGLPQAYSLLVQKQPGAAPARIQSYLRLPRFSTVLWSSPADVVTGGDGYHYENALATDVSWGLVFASEKK